MCVIFLHSNSCVHINSILIYVAP